MAELEKLRRDICACKHKVVNICLCVCTFGHFTLKFHLLNHPIENILGLRGISVLDASAYKQFSTGIKAAYRYTSD